MKTNRFLSVCLILFAISTLSSGQTLEWSNTQKLRGNSIFTTIIGEDEAGIYVLRHRNKFISKFIVLERYRHNLGLESSKSYLLKNTRIVYTDVNETGILLIKEVYDRKKNSSKLIATLLNNSFEAIQPEMTINLPYQASSVNDPIFSIKPSPDHKHYLILYNQISNSNKNFYGFAIIDQRVNTINSGELLTDEVLNTGSIENVVLDKNLKITLLINLKKNQNHFNSFAIYEQNTLKIIADTSYSFEKPVLFYNPITNEKGVTGYYTSNIENGFEGDFSLSWKNLNEDSIHIKTQQFSHSILKELVGETKAQTGFLPSSYIPLKLICRTDGGFVKISENTFIQKEQDIMVVNGVPSAQGKNIYIFENIIIRNFDSTGSLTWENWITKNQNSVNDGGLLGSAFVSATQYSVNVLYNDPIATGGDIVLAKILLNGQSEIKVTAKGEEMNSFIIPAEGRQISADKIIVPVLKDRKFALLKITFKQ